MWLEQEGNMKEYERHCWYRKMAYKLCKTTHQAICNAEINYFKRNFQEINKIPKEIFRIANELLSKCDPPPLSKHSNPKASDRWICHYHPPSDEFKNYFLDNMTTNQLKIIEKQELKDKEYYISERNNLAVGKAEMVK